nr:hypothetical protein [uncultured Anaerosporobacter sp.]
MKDNKITIKDVERNCYSLIKDKETKTGAEIAFDGFSCEITECIEMLGLYTFVIENKDNCLSEIDMNISMYGKIQFDNG